MLSVYSVDSIIIVRDAGYDEWNQPNPSTLESVKGYVEWKTRLVRNLAGEEVISSGHVLLDYDGTIDHQDKLRINSKDYPILTIEKGKDFSNVVTTVYFQ